MELPAVSEELEVFLREFIDLETYNEIALDADFTL